MRYIYIIVFSSLLSFSIKVVGNLIVCDPSDSKINNTKNKKGIERTDHISNNLFSPTITDLKINRNIHCKKNNITNMGGGLTIAVEGKKAIELVTKAVKKDSNFVLYLNRVPMTHLSDHHQLVVMSAIDDGKPVTTSEPCQDKLHECKIRHVITFNLTRDPSSEKSRQMWNSYFSTEKSFNYIMQPDISLKIGSAIPIKVYSDPKDPFKFSVNSKNIIWSVIVIGLLLFLVAYYWLVKHSNMMREFPDGPFSLGRSQMAFWVLIIAISYFGIFIITGQLEYFPPQLLVLLGISGTTGLGAIMITNQKASTKQVEREQAEKLLSALQSTVRNLEQQTALSEKSVSEKQEISGQLEEAKTDIGHLTTKISQLKKTHKIPARKNSLGDDVRSFWVDLCNDGNGMSIHRFQSVVWTLMLGIFFIYKAANEISMPVFSSTLLILMGISGTTYIGFKIPEKPSSQS